MKPGDLIKVDPADWVEGDEEARRIVLTAVPAPHSKENPVTARLKKDEVGLVIAIAIIERQPTGRWEAAGSSLEALVLFGQRLGWNDAQCFSVL